MNALCCAEMRKAPAVAEGLWRGKSAVAGKAQVKCILPQRAQRTPGIEGLDSSLRSLGSMWLKTPGKFFGFLEKFSHFNVKFRKVFGYFFSKKDPSLPYRSVSVSHCYFWKTGRFKKRDFAKRTHLGMQATTFTINSLHINSRQNVQAEAGVWTLRPGFAALRHNFRKEDNPLSGRHKNSTQFRLSIIALQCNRDAGRMRKWRTANNESIG